MQDMIRKIIEMDKEARRLTAEAQARRSGAADAIERKKSEVSESFVNMARSRVETIRTSEMRDAAAVQQQLERSDAEVTARLEEVYKSCHEQWVAEIVRRVTEGEDLQ